MKLRLTGATFVAASKTVTHTSFSDITLAGIQLIVNVTDQIIIYNFADTTKGGTLSTDTLTLEYDTTTMSDTDELMILVDDATASMAINDGGNTITVDGTVAVTNAGLTALNGAIAGTEVQVDVLTMPTVTVTATNLDVQSGGADLATTTQAGAIQTAVETIDNAIHVDDAAFTLGTHSGVMMMGFAGTQSVNANDAGAIAMETDGSVHIHDGGNTITVDGTVTANLAAGTNNIGDVDIASIAAGDNNIGNVDIASIAAGDNNIGNVDVVTLPALAAGTNAIGKLLPPNIDVTGHTNYAKKYYTNAGAVTDGIIWSPAAGTRWHITSIYIQTSAAATITLEDDLAGGDSPVWKSEFTANQGVYMNFDPMYAWASGEDAADLIITTTAGNVYVTVVGYEI